MAANIGEHNEPGFRPDLQGLRAIAILLVVLAHAGVPWLAGGFVGVDVFFVLSGYLITGLLVREFDRSGRIGLLTFYARRLKRLLPALTVVVLVTIGFANWLLSPFEASAQLASTPFAATWTSNLWFVFSTLDYFDELAASDLFLHTWSLGVEEQFYLVWPVMLLAVMASVRTRGEPARRRALFATLSVALVLSLGLSLYWSQAWPTAAFYLMPSRVWQFSLGALVYLATARLGACHPAPNPGSPLRWAWGVLAGGLLLVLGSAVLLHAELVYPGLYALAPSLGAAALIWSGHLFVARGGGPLAHPAMVWIGDRSYSWYLWHWPVLGIGVTLGFQAQVGPVTGLVLMSLLLAMLTYRMVELPFWKGRISTAPTSRILLVSLLVMLAVVAVWFNWKRSLVTEIPIAGKEIQWRQDFPDIYRLPCDAWFQHARVEPCEFGNPDGEKTVVLLGDSIGLQWFSAFEKIYAEKDWHIIVLTKSACALADVEYFYERINARYDVCTEWRNGVVEHLEEVRPDLLIIGSYAPYPLDQSEWIQGTKRILDRLAPVSGQIILVPGTPDLGFNGPGCLARNTNPDGSVNRLACVTEGRFEVPDRVTGYLEKAVEGHANAWVLDLNDLVCPKRVCAASSEDGILTFRDNQHLSDSFVRSLTPQIRSRIEKVFLDGRESSD